MRSFGLCDCALLQSATLQDLLAQLQPEQLWELRLGESALSAATLGMLPRLHGLTRLELTERHEGLPRGSLNGLAALRRLRHLRCNARRLPPGMAACIAQATQVSLSGKGGHRAACASREGTGHRRLARCASSHGGSRGHRQPPSHCVCAERAHAAMPLETHEGRTRLRACCAPPLPPAHPAVPVPGAPLLFPAAHPAVLVPPLPRSSPCCLW